MLADADRAETHRLPNQPGRVQLHQISWYPKNRGGQGVMPMHMHDVAYSVVTHGTSKRRYDRVLLVEVPANVVETWLDNNRKKSRLNPLLANFDAMGKTGPFYAPLGCTHFVEAHKLIREGNRRYRNNPDGIVLQLKPDDVEGKIIQEQGVQAVVYSSALWHDTAALLAIMREDNLNAEVAKRETELDAFGHVSRVVSDLAGEGCEPHEKKKSRLTL